MKALGSQLNLRCFLVAVAIAAATRSGRAAITFSFGLVNGTSVPNSMQNALTQVGLMYDPFFNLNANIDVEFGSIPGALGESEVPITDVPYSTWLADLKDDATSTDDATAIANLPNTHPAGIGNGTVAIAAANARALGITPSGSIDGFDGVITFSNSADFFFRNGGSIGSNQFDFFTVAEHEIDEVLGTFSCVTQCDGAAAAADFFRYQSAGVRSFGASSTNPAFFSIDGQTMLVQYNNQNNGEDFGDWASTGSCPPDVPRVQNAVACPGQSVDLGVETRVLDVIGYNTVQFNSTPEPGTLLFLGVGLTTLVAVGSCRRKRGAALGSVAQLAPSRSLERSSSLYLLDGNCSSCSFLKLCFSRNNSVSPRCRV